MIITIIVVIIIFIIIIIIFIVIININIVFIIYLQTNHRIYSASQSNSLESHRVGLLYLCVREMRECCISTVRLAGPS